MLSPQYSGEKAQLMLIDFHEETTKTTKTIAWTYGIKISNTVSRLSFFNYKKWLNFGGFNPILLCSLL
jgi:hypothetical protein